VEGLIGTPSQQGYDFLGESVNTAKRLCDHAAGGEVLISEQALEELDIRVRDSDVREFTGKGGSTSIKAYSLDPIG
jgi:class 3 adenylate cyclase